MITTTKSKPQEQETYLLEIELNEKIRLETMLDIIYVQFGICYKIRTVEIEYFDTANYGHIQLFIETDNTTLTQLTHYMVTKKILCTTFPYQLRNVI